MVIMPKIKMTEFEVLILQLLASTFFQPASYTDKLTPAVQTLDKVMLHHKLANLLKLRSKQNNLVVVEVTLFKCLSLLHSRLD